MKFIGEGNFQNSGAADAETVALAISLAGIKAMESRMIDLTAEDSTTH